MSTVDENLQERSESVLPGRSGCGSLLNSDAKPPSDCDTDESLAEYRRYLSVRSRGIDFDEAKVLQLVRGRRVFVTGATGCVGSELLRQLARFCPESVVGIGITDPTELVAGVEYQHVDVTDGPSVRRMFALHRPEVVFHLAAQRDPGYAERSVYGTVLTNILGTANVLDSCVRYPPSSFVFASTGKAMRPHTRDVYAATKKIAEWLISQAAAKELFACTAARFTHVVDNAIVVDRFRTACALGEPIRLHARESLFYVQSAREAAQLLLSSLDDRVTSVLKLTAIRDLGWPIKVFDVAVGVRSEAVSTVPICVVGEEQGYEQGVYPGLYDPITAGDISPLFNAYEAAHVSSEGVSAVDYVVSRSTSVDLSRDVSALVRACVDCIGEDEVRSLLSSTLWKLLDGILSAVSNKEVLVRMVRIASSYRDEMSEDYRAIDHAIRQQCFMGADRQ